MKIFILILCTCYAILMGCQKKTMPVITDRKTEPAAPVTATIPVVPDTLVGKNVFNARCARCHDLPDPGKFTVQRWDDILVRMMPRARLDNEQRVHIKAYLNSQAKTGL
jgi:hypothetical protein